MLTIMDSNKGMGGGIPNMMGNMDFSQFGNMGGASKDEL